MASIFVWNAAAGALTPTTHTREAPLSVAGSEAFTTQGCTTWTVPGGDTSVAVDAIGAAGSNGGGSGGDGGAGDEVAGTLTALTPGQALDICVDSGGGRGNNNGGGGGGASGVSLAADFSVPMVVAGGGGGGGGGGLSSSPIGGAGGAAGSPSGASGGAADGTAGAGGMQSGPGGNGASSTSNGPGTGGVGTFGCGGGGGGGGAGYTGGGGGGSSSCGGMGDTGGGCAGGGGADYCDGSVSGCTVTTGSGTQTVAGASSGDAQVTLSFDAVVPGAPTIGVASGNGPGSVVVPFTPPVFDGGSPITGYTVTAIDGTTSANSQTASAAGSPFTFNGLTNGDSYTFTVVATNLVGNSQPSAPSNAVVPPAALVSFTTQGCTTWDVPDGVTSVQIGATGAAGQNAGASGGTGDEVSANLSGLTDGQALDICVDSGGAGGGGGTEGGGGGGSGGGASGVSVGSDFNNPVLVAAGGGGGGGSDECAGLCGSGGGGSAGSPSGGTGGSVNCTYGGGSASGGGGGGQSTVGSSGGTTCALADGNPQTGFLGSAPSSSGPGGGGHGGGGGGRGGGGGGGGGGYYGGGGGGGGNNSYGGGGAGGGSDYCVDTSSISSCAVTSGSGTGTVAGDASGDAQVTLTYVPMVAPGAPTIGTARGGDTKARVNFTAPSYNGGSAVTGYTVTATDQSNSLNGGQTAEGTSTSIAVTGLTDGDSYTFTVTATNAVGTGVPSGPSNAVVSDPLPSVSSISPPAGPLVGGQAITITGTGFTTGDTVEIGQGDGLQSSAIAATGVTYVSSIELTATTGAAKNNGTYNVFVITPGGTNVGQRPIVTYIYGHPGVTSVSPAAGPLVGGQDITITGSGFTPGATVEIGLGQGLNASDIAATDVTYVSRTELTAVTGAATKAGNYYYVHVVTAGGTNKNTSGARYEYERVVA